MDGVIFDFNGTLFWDTKKHHDAWFELSRVVRGYPFSDEEFVKLTGHTNRSIMQYLSPGELSEQKIHEMSMEKEKIYRELCRKDPDNLHLAPGAIDFLNYLRDNKVPRTIASSSEITNIRFFIEVFKLEQWFDIDRIVYDQGLFPGKPFPDIYLKAVEVLGLDASKCIVFEDAQAGIESAYKAKIGEIYCINGDSKKDFAHLPGVTGVINDFNDFDRSIIITKH